jgi:spore maturation protein CgeB
MSFDTLVRQFSRARVVLGVSNVGSMDDVTIMKGRDFEVPMCGACYLTQYVDELADFFAIGRDVLCYQTASQAADTLASLLRDEARRRELEKNALRRSLDHNTWEHRITAMYAMLLGQG